MAKLKGFAFVRVPDDTIQFAEIHWYEAHGIAKETSRSKEFLGNSYDYQNLSSICCLSEK